MIRKVFDRNVNRSNPIPYSEFMKIGMSKEEYIKYFELCELLRAMVISFYSVGGKDFRDYYEKSYKKVKNALISLFDPYCEKNLDIRAKISCFPSLYGWGFLTMQEIDRSVFGDSVRKPENNKDGKDINSVMCIGIDTFRVWMEYMIAVLISDDYIMDKKKLITDFRGKRLEEFRNVVKSSYIPKMSDDISKSDEIYLWATFAERYSVHLNYEDVIDGVEELFK